MMQFVMLTDRKDKDLGNLQMDGPITLGTSHGLDVSQKELNYK